jgi:hypothetical protein
MKKKVKEKQRLRKALRRHGACMACGPLLIDKVIEPGTKAIVFCFSCNREILLPVAEEALRNEKARELLYRYGRMVALHENRPATHYTFMLDGKILMADQDCGCTEDDSCPHTRIIIRLETSK